MDIFVEELLETLQTTAFVIPFLYLSFLLVGFFSHNEGGKYSKILHHTKKAGPLAGAFLGIIPQCGFSGVMSNLFSHKVITIGTLFAAFIATSDEAIIAMVSMPQFIPKLLLLIAIKLVYAIAIGYAIDIVFNIIKKHKKLPPMLKKQMRLVRHSGQAAGMKTFLPQICPHCQHDHDHDNQHEKVHNHEENCDHNTPDDEFLTSGCKHEHSHSHCCATNIFVDALLHTAILTLYIFVATLAINLLTGYFHIETIQSVFPQNAYLQILIACAIGLIPNCASAVLLVEMYMGGIIAFAPLVAGLCAGAGVGLIVLFSANKKHILKNLLILGGLFVTSFVCGVITSFLPI